MPPKRTKNLDLARGMVRRTDGSISRKFSLYLEPELAKRFQIRCVELGAEMSEVIAKLVVAWLEPAAAGAKPKAKTPR